MTDSNLNYRIVEAKALENTLVCLHSNYATGLVNVLPIKNKILRLLQLQKELKEDYSVDYDSSLLYDFTSNEEVTEDVNIS